MLQEIIIDAFGPNRQQKIQTVIYRVIGKPIAVFIFGDQVDATLAWDVQAFVNYVLRNRKKFDTVIIQVQSGGGSVTDGERIYREVEKLKFSGIHVIAEITWAASMAAMTALSADETRMTSSGMGMCHPVSAREGANRRTMQKTGDDSEDFDTFQKVLDHFPSMASFERAKKIVQKKMGQGGIKSLDKKTTLTFEKMVRKDVNGTHEWVKHSDEPKNKAVSGFVLRHNIDGAHAKTTRLFPPTYAEDIHASADNVHYTIQSIVKDHRMWVGDGNSYMNYAAEHWFNIWKDPLWSALLGVKHADYSYYRDRYGIVDPKKKKKNPKVSKNGQAGGGPMKKNNAVRPKKNVQPIPKVDAVKPTAPQASRNKRNNAKANKAKQAKNNTVKKAVQDEAKLEVKADVQDEVPAPVFTGYDITSMVPSFDLGTY
jgi:ATP-dependent protease ClpP protease subunit